MKQHGDYGADGYALLEGLIPPEVVRAFLHQMQSDFRLAGKSYREFAATSSATRKVSIEIYGYAYKPMIAFLWGLTPAMCAVTGRELLPTYNFLRLYQSEDILRVHSDRGACEHSLSLTLAYGDDKVWPFEIGHEPVAEAKPLADDFAGEGFSSLAMQPGDAVLYQGVTRRHGRIAPNPNRWSAHMFLHWVDRDGPHRDAAFDGNAEIPDRIEFF